MTLTQAEKSIFLQRKRFSIKVKVDLFVPCSPQNGLMLAVAKGFIDIVTMLHMCPLIDINHQDTDGNTAIMIAAQAGMSDDIHST